MSVAKLDSIKQYLVGSLIVSVIGGFTILFGEFAAWDESNYYIQLFSGDILTLVLKILSLQ